MNPKVTGITPTVLQWARETRGYSVEQVAIRLNRDVDEIISWESGESTPTYPQLERLAYQIYKRPLAVFFLPQPPDEPDPKRQFRTLPDFELDNLSVDTRYHLRLAQVYQLSLKELNDGINPAARKIFRDISLSVTDDVPTASERVREYIGVPLNVQLEWRDTDEALKAWRIAVEDTGIFVFKNAFKQKEISGFCLLDDNFPVIYLNNSTGKTRQIFSLFHELGHILLGVFGITKFDKTYINHLQDREKRIERFCNAFAAEVLIPSTDFDRQVKHIDRESEELVINLADRYRVSREAILRRLLDRGMVSRELYLEKAIAWADQSTEKKSGGDYYANRATYLGDRYLQLVFKQHYQGKLSPEQVAEYLGIKTGSIPGLEEYALRKAVPE